MLPLLSAVRLTALACVLWVAPAAGADPGSVVFFREDFDSLDRWQPLKFTSIRNMSEYTIEKLEGGDSCVKATSSKSASGMVWTGDFNVYEHPVIRWRWKVSNVYSRGNALSKKGDDYPLRVYVIFQYDPEDPNVVKGFRYGLARALYGKYPPYSSLTYIWANREQNKPYLPNPYAKEVMMVPLQSGGSMAGQWVFQERNVLSDYREAFGTDPPSRAGLAFMNDSDNTGESSESWIDWIEISRVQEPGD